MSSPKARRQLGCLTLVVVAVVLLPAAGVHWLLQGLRGGPLPPQRTTRPVRSVENNAQNVAVTGCGLRVRAAYYTDYLHVEEAREWWEGLRFAPEGPSPIASVTVQVQEQSGATRRLVVQAREVVELRDLPCGERAEVFIEGDNGSSNYAWPTRPVAPEVEVLELPVRPLRAARGVVVSAQDGAPIEGAFIFSRAMGVGAARSGADGRFTWVGGAGPRSRDDPYAAASERPNLEATALGFERRTAAAPAVLSDNRPPELTFRLRPQHDVVVRCDFPDATGCPGEVWCTGPMELGDWYWPCPSGHPSLGVLDADALVCNCPDTGATLRGMGLAVAVPDDVDHVVLEPPGGAALRGQVLGVEPGHHQVTATLVPAALHDLPRLGLVKHRAEPDAEGRWTLSGLPAGDWLVEVEIKPAFSELNKGEWPERALRVAADGLRGDEQRDLGALTVPPAGAVRLRCLDSLTGEEGGLPADSVIARLEGASGALGLPVLSWCGTTITGLNPGTWTIYRLPRLWERGTLRLRGGELQELVLGGDEAGEPQQPLGLALSRGEDGLLIDAVDANGLGAELGLQPGDRLTGAAIGPLSLPIDALLGKDAEAEAVLELLELASEAEAEGLLGAMGLHLEVEPAADDTGGAPPPG